jgi:phosphopantetheinyl transferase
LGANRWQLPPQTCGPVVCAAISSSKEHLLRQLLAASAGQDSLDLRWQDLELSLGSLGEPLVIRDGLPVLSVSFSQDGRRIWGALTGAGRVGIDVALASEFPPDYPLDRVFSQEEFDRTCTLLGGTLSRTAALLWSLKEAAVKALGVGFNYLSPREIIIRPGKPYQGGYLFEVDAGYLVKTWARPEGKGWLALALIA